MESKLFCLHDLKCAPTSFKKIKPSPKTSCSHICKLRSKGVIEQILLFTEGQWSDEKNDVNIDIFIPKTKERQRLCTLNKLQSCFQWTDASSSVKLPRSNVLTLEATITTPLCEATTTTPLCEATRTTPLCEATTTPLCEATRTTPLCELVSEEMLDISSISSPPVTRITDTDSNSPFTKITVADKENMKQMNETTPVSVTSCDRKSSVAARKRKQSEETTPKPKCRRQKMTMRALIPDKGRTPPAKQPLEEMADLNGVAHSQRSPPSDSSRITRCVDLSLRAPKPSNRWGHTMTLVNSKQAVLIGGQGEKQLSRDSIWVLDPETRSWKCPTVNTEGAKPEFRIGHSATYDPTMRCIYVYGGSKQTKWFHDVHMFDLDENKWTLVKVSGKAPTRAYHSATLYRHELWMFGGVFPKPDPQPDGCDNEVHIFSPVMENWYKPIVTGDKPRQRSGHSATLLNYQLVIFGGWDFPYCYNDLFILDLTTVDWSSPTIFGQPPKPRSWHASCALSNNRIFIHGGYDGDIALHDAFIFDLDTKSWQNLAVENAPSPRAGHACMSLPSGYENKDEDEVIVFGGGDNDGSYYSDMLSFYVPFQHTSVTVSE